LRRADLAGGARRVFIRRGNGAGVQPHLVEGKNSDRSG
jgi:hypothetical protein